MQTNLFAVGSRKTATAKVWLAVGNGEIKINNRSAKDYLGRDDLLKLINTPFKVLGLENQYNVVAKVRGGGLSAQAGAIALGIARALVLSNEEFRKPLKDAGLLKRDPREKERMKYGLAKRRKSFQWTKR
ncbi:MAG: 30S ribosomal protein S9 [candidate division WOR-3 bacterium]